MYKLIIVDDEQISREGLANVVDWNALGYTVEGVFDDGKSAVNYLTSHHTVDVILTDIRMNEMSGIEVAEHIHERHPEVKVVFMSAYKDFEYARQAINYNVEHYLLKPISMSEIKEIFKKIKKQLDDMEVVNQQKTEKEQSFNEIQIERQKQFFTNIIMGAFRNKEYIQKRLMDLKLNITLEKSVCCIFDIIIENYEEFLNNNWDYGKDGLSKVVYNFFSLEDNHAIKFYPVIKKEQTIRFVAIIENDMEKDEFNKLIQTNLKSIQQGIKSLFGLNIKYDVKYLFNNILELASYTIPLNISAYQKEDLFKDIVYEDELNIVREQQKLLLMSIINTDKEMAMSLFEKLFRQLEPMGIDAIRSVVIDLIAVLKYQLNETGIKGYSIEYGPVLNATDVQTLLDWCKAFINNTIKYISDNKEKNKINSSKNIVERAKKHIQQNLDKDISLENMADYLFISPVYFSRLFKEQTGENFIDFVIKLRIEKAAQLLKDTDKKIYEICNEIGYANVRYFYKVFKRHTGCTPTQYREKVEG